MKLSVVTTLYHSEPYINEFYSRILKSIKSITNDYEILFVNDGSPDSSLEKVLVLREKDPNVKLIDLSKNFGHHKALMTGLKYSKGDHVFLIDVDLEEEPELLLGFWDELKNSVDLDVVYGVQKNRKGHLFEKISGFLFFRLFNLVSDVKIPVNFSTVRLMTRRYVEALVGYDERVMLFSGLTVLTGYKQKPIEIKKYHRAGSTYSLFKKIDLFFDHITALTSKPLVYIFYLGLIITLISLLFLIKIIFQYVFYGVGIQGWTSIIVSVWFLGGLMLFCVGFIGIYLSRIFVEVKKRPYSIVKKEYL